MRFREMLAQIDTMLAQNDADSRKLWNVLTALRGPDDDNFEVKLATTARIRSHAFPKTFEVGHEGYGEYQMVNGAMFAEGDLPPSNYSEAGAWHFNDHVRQAVYTLNLPTEYPDDER